jgi:hypothetical protein
VFKEIVADAVKIIGIEPDLLEEIEHETETSFANLNELESGGRNP